MSDQVINSGLSARRLIAAWQYANAFEGPVIGNAKEHKTHEAKHREANVRLLAAARDLAWHLTQETKECPCPYRCSEPVHNDDGVNYCTKCGLCEAARIMAP